MDALLVRGEAVHGAPSQSGDEHLLVSPVIDIAVTRRLASHSAKPNPDRDELVQYDGVESPRISASGGAIIHRALPCGRAGAPGRPDPARSGG